MRRAGNVKADETAKGYSGGKKKNRQQMSYTFKSGLCARFLTQSHKLIFKPRATECKYTFIYVGNMVSEALCGAEINTGRLFISDRGVLRLGPSGGCGTTVAALH